MARLIFSLNLGGGGFVFWVLGGREGGFGRERLIFVGFCRDLSVRGNGGRWMGGVWDLGG